ncbi:hypothetical protein CAEBREN_20821 [Caenorhabditis brenneri]|uniref:Uncharacterized protein n=1 Tax=Caenorhabditis brenneri TaxID=135651 RepID=G0NCP5_CAEBE|nr:hypothetical protein CAEBREN_20821 [Caenorhabditis brenneri]
MSKQLFLLLAVFVMASIARKEFPSRKKLAAEFLAAGVKQQYIDQFFNTEQSRADRVAAAAAEEKKTGKKGLRDAVYQKEREDDIKMFESWPEEQTELLSGVWNKYVMP